MIDWKTNNMRMNHMKNEVNLTHQRKLILLIVMLNGDWREYLMIQI